MSHVVVSKLAYAHPCGELLFEGVSFRIPPGQHVGLVGANGVGKSTLLRVLAGELPADDGTVDIGTFAYMPQDVGIGAGQTHFHGVYTAMALDNARNHRGLIGRDSPSEGGGRQARQPVVAGQTVMTSPHSSGTSPCGDLLREVPGPQIALNLSLQFTDWQVSVPTCNLCQKFPPNEMLTWNPYHRER
jgi:energy-coupling factor transporter ATP-binding protein EcfA2